MEIELKVCCILVLKLLNRLLEEGMITLDEYKEHVKMKLAYLVSLSPE